MLYCMYTHNQTNAEHGNRVRIHQALLDGNELAHRTGLDYKIAAILTFKMHGVSCGRRLPKSIA